MHFPWCLQKCPYCDFASGTINRGDVPHGAYADAVKAELERRAAVLAGHRLESVFFGGGTPSLWRAESLGAVLGAIRGAFDSEKPSLEVTVECNPSSLDEATAASLRQAGINRLSIGVQSLDDQRLRYLGRLHDAEGALSAVAAAQSAFERVSADLMFGMPGQRPAELVDEIKRLTDTGLRHLSAYALTIEPGTRFGQLHSKGKLKVAGDEAYASCFEAAEAELCGQGFEHYEVSNYAQPREHSQHNQHYWRGGAYLGLGAAAVGCLHPEVGEGRRYRNDPRPEQYLSGSGRADIEVFTETLGPQELIREALMLGLRTSEGVDLQALAERAGVDLFEGRQHEVNRALSNGNLVHADNRLKVPHDRWLHLDTIVADLF